MNEQCGNVYENKGPAFNSSGRSGNVIENTGSYASKTGMLLKGQVVSRWGKNPEVTGGMQKAERCNESRVQCGRCFERVVDKFIGSSVKQFCFGHNILSTLSHCPNTAIFLDN